MFDKRLMAVCPESKKYIAGNIFFQWLELMMNVLMIFVLSKGVEKLYDQALANFTPTELYLPCSLKAIGEYVFNQYRIDPNVLIYVYSDCPALPEIKRQLKEHKDSYVKNSYSQGQYRIVLEELGQSFEVWARDFVKGLCDLYNAKTSTTEDEVRDLFNNTIGDLGNLKNCRKAIGVEAEKSQLHNVKALMSEDDDETILYRRLPRELAEDINQTVENRIREEKRTRYKKIAELSNSDRIGDLSDAITLLEKSREIKNVETLIDRCEDKINRIKRDEYEAAITLASEGSEEALLSAIEKIESIDPFEDSQVRIADFKKQHENERKYIEAITLSNSDSPKQVYEALKTLESLGGYKDAADHADKCRKSIRVFADRYQEKAEESLKEGYEKKLREAMSTYKEILSWEYDEQKKRACQEKVDSIQELLRLKSKVSELWRNHAQLRSAFKKKERKIVEANIRDVERRIDEIQKELGNEDISRSGSISDSSIYQSEKKRSLAKWVVIVIAVILVGALAFLIPSIIQPESTADNGYMGITSAELQTNILSSFSEQWPDIEVVDETNAYFDNGYGALFYEVGDTSLEIRTQSVGEDYSYNSPIDYCLVIVGEGTYGNDCIALIANELFGASVSQLKEDVEENYELSRKEVADGEATFKGNDYSDPDFQLTVAYQEVGSIAMILPLGMDGYKVLEWSGIVK